MNNLMCSVNTCTHNQNNLCCREYIKVAGKNTITANFTSCENFRRKEGELTNNAQLPKNSLNVLCEAENCKYNNNQKCEADNISIEGSYALSGIQTECATFSSKIDK